MFYQIIPNIHFCSPTTTSCLVKLPTYDNQTTICSSPLQGAKTWQIWLNTMTYLLCSKSEDFKQSNQQKVNTSTPFIFNQMFQLKFEFYAQKLHKQLNCTYQPFHCLTFSSLRSDISCEHMVISCHEEIFSFYAYSICQVCFDM